MGGTGTCIDSPGSTVPACYSQISTNKNGGGGGGGGGKGKERKERKGERKESYSRILIAKL
jgi:hypothetical protein